MPDTVKMTVSMDVTIPQALALQAMFKYWNYLSNIGASRKVAFYVDGDGNFHPKCDISFDKNMPSLTEKIEEISVVSDENGNRVYDFDPVAWSLRK